MRLTRRRFGQLLVAASFTVAGQGTRAVRSAEPAQLASIGTNWNRVRGLLIGGMLGDAMGGPVEFAARETVRSVLPNTRDWPAERVLSTVERDRLASTLPLLAYKTLRPDPAPYGPWVANASAGTVTDDTRHKIVLMRTLGQAARENRWPVTAKSLAAQYVGFQPCVNRPPDDATRALADEGLLQYRYAARWLLGERDLHVARPLERLWAGIDNCSGQMLLPPLAAIYAGAPDAAYRAAYAIDFVDTPAARDMAAALAAGLAAALSTQLDQSPVTERWHSVLTAMRHTDPYGTAEVPFAGRPLHRWMDLAESIASRANGRPATLFELLEREGRSVYGWDAHYTLLVPLAMLRFCEYDVLAALHLTLDFGHDTDSYAQVVGCLGGAVAGESIFPEAMRQAVEHTIREDYGESVDDWLQILQLAAKRFRQGVPVVARMDTTTP